MLTALPDTAPTFTRGASNDGGLPAEAEAARYALLRRLGPALRHDLVVHLQAVALMAEVLGARLERDPQGGNLPEQLARMHLLTREAVAGALQVAGWLLPPEDDTIDLRQGLEESLGLVRSSLGFRGLQLQTDLPEAGLSVSRERLRHLLLAALLYLSDQGGTAGALEVRARQESGGALLRLALVAREAGSTERVVLGEEAGYRPLQWSDVQALAGEAGATRHFSPPVVELRLPRAEARTPLQIAPR